MQVSEGVGVEGWEGWREQKSKLGDPHLVPDDQEGHRSGYHCLNGYVSRGEVDNPVDNNGREVLIRAKWAAKMNVT